MRSIYDDVVSALESTTFSITGVAIRNPYDESPKEYPLIVVHEITNLPKSHSTSGEDTTALAYQLDIQTTNCTNTIGTVLSRWEAGRALESEATDALESALKLTRRARHEVAVAPDVLSIIWRGECVADSSNYVYRK